VPGPQELPLEAKRKEKEIDAMTHTKKSLAAAFFTIVLVSAGVLLAQQKTITVEGYVLDSACAFTKNLEKPISRECALACAKQGSQLVILTKDGNIYWPIDSATPAKSQNARLTEFAGNRVTATGKLYDRGGSHALVIEQIAAAK
jgi:type 1 fimbria pilin